MAFSRIRWASLMPGSSASGQINTSRPDNTDKSQRVIIPPPGTLPTTYWVNCFVAALQVLAPSTMSTGLSGSLAIKSEFLRGIDCGQAPTHRGGKSWACAMIAGFGFPKIAGRIILPSPESHRSSTIISSPAAFLYWNTWSGFLFWK